MVSCLMLAFLIARCPIARAPTASAPSNSFLRKPNDRHLFGRITDRSSKRRCNSNRRSVVGGKDRKDRYGKSTGETYYLGGIAASRQASRRGPAGQPRRRGQKPAGRLLART